MKASFWSWRDGKGLKYWSGGDARACGGQVKETLASRSNKTGITEPGVLSLITANRSHWEERPQNTHLRGDLLAES